MRRVVRVTYAALAWLLVAGILVQVFMAGMGLFGARSNWDIHIGLGHLLGAVVLLDLIVVFFTGYPRGTKWLTVWLFVNYFLLADIVIFIRKPPYIAALHPVLAVLLFATAFAVARGALRLLPRSQASGRADSLQTGKILAD